MLLLLLLICVIIIVIKGLLLLTIYCVTASINSIGFFLHNTGNLPLILIHTIISVDWHNGSCHRLNYGLDRWDGLRLLLTIFCKRGLFHRLPHLSLVIGLLAVKDYVGTLACLFMRVKHPGLHRREALIALFSLATTVRDMILDLISCKLDWTVWALLKGAISILSRCANWSSYWLLRLILTLVLLVIHD